MSTAAERPIFQPSKGVADWAVQKARTAMRTTTSARPRVATDHVIAGTGATRGQSSAQIPMKPRAALMEKECPS